MVNMITYVRLIAKIQSTIEAVQIHQHLFLKQVSSTNLSMFKKP